MSVEKDSGMAGPGGPGGSGTRFRTNRLGSSAEYMPQLTAPTSTTFNTQASFDHRRSSTASYIHAADSSPYIDPTDLYVEAMDLTDRENLNTNRLKHAATTSALLAGFALEAFVQMDIDDGLPEWLMILFAVNTVSLIACNLFALLTSVCLLPTITSYNIVVMRRLKKEGRATPREHSPHLRFHGFIITAWLASTVIGIEFFLFEVIVVSWVHFYTKSKLAATCATCVIAPAMIFFAIFAKLLHQGVIDMHLGPLKHALDRGMEETSLLLPPEIPQDPFGSNVDFDQFFDASDARDRIYAPATAGSDASDPSRPVRQ